jgi:hypothetical protein
MQDSSDDDIQVISVQRQLGSRSAPITRPRNQTEFFAQELGLETLGSRLNFSALKKALAKYDVEAADDQIQDMVNMADIQGISSIINSAT